MEKGVQKGIEKVYQEALKIISANYVGFTIRICFQELPRNLTFLFGFHVNSNAKSFPSLSL
jgi:hypothetical protein